MSEPFHPVFNQNDVELLERKDSFNGFFRIETLNLKHRLFEGGWSREISRELFIRGDAVGMLLLDPARKQVALVEQYRIGPYSRGDEPWVLELVAGMIDKAESPEQVGIREAEEEAGCLVRELEPIAQYYSSPGGSSEYFYLFCGLVDMAGVGGIHGLDEEAEDIKVHVISTEQIFAELDQGHFRNAHTLIALQWLKLNRRRFEL